MSAKAKAKLTPEQRKATLTRVLHKIRPYSLFVVCSLIVAAVSVAAQLYIPILCGDAIDLMLGKGNVDFAGVGRIIVEVLVVAVVAAFAQWLLSVCNNRITFSVSRDLRNEALRKIQFAPLAVFCTFFVAELGDKTQLTAITFGANEGMGAAFIVWIGCSLGLFLADILGMLVGYLLKSKTPDGLLNTLAFVIFAIFGIYTAYQALNLISESVCPITVWPLLAAVTVAFVVICVWLYMKKKKG